MTSSAIPESLLRYYRENLREVQGRIERTGGPSKFVKLSSGNNRLRYLPDKDPEKSFFVPGGIHRNLGQQSKSFVYCPKLCISKKERCPICDFCDLVKEKSKKAAELELAKKLTVKVRAWANVLHRDDEHAGVLMFGYGPQIQYPLLKLIAGDAEGKEKPEYMDLLDLYDGRDVIVNREGTGFNTRYELWPARDSSQLDKAWLDEAHDIRAYIEKRVFSAKELDRVLDGEDPWDIVKERGTDVEEEDDDGHYGTGGGPSRRRVVDDERDRPRGGSRSDDRDDRRDQERSRDREEERPRYDREEAPRGSRGRDVDERDNDRRPRELDDRDRRGDDRRPRELDDRDRSRDSERDAPRRETSRRGDDTDSRNSRDRDDRGDRRDREERDRRDDRDGRRDERDREEIRPRGSRDDTRDDRKDVDNAAGKALDRLRGQATGERERRK